MKRILLAALTLALALGAFGCAAEETEYPNATLLACQSPEDDETGITYAETAITWEEKVVTRVRVSVTYATPEQAEAARDAVAEDYGAAAELHSIELEGSLLSYDLSVGKFRGVSYEEMVKSYEKDGDWTVIGQQPPAGEAVQ